MIFNMKYLVSTTIDNKKNAENLAKKIINAKLGACVQIVPIKSFYMWKGKMEQTSEFRLDIKTLAEKYHLLEKLIINNHTYDVPEIIAVPIVRGYKKYLDWVNKNG